MSKLSTIFSLVGPKQRSIIIAITSHMRQKRFLVCRVDSTTSSVSDLHILHIFYHSIYIIKNQLHVVTLCRVLKSSKSMHSGVHSYVKTLVDSIKKINPTILLRRHQCWCCHINHLQLMQKYT